MKNRKIITLILSVMMVICTMPSFVFAVDSAPAEPQNAPEVSEEAAAAEESADDSETAAGEETPAVEETQEESVETEEATKDATEKADEEKLQHDEAKPEQDETKPEKEEEPVAFEESETVDEVKVTVSAEEGAFPEGAKLAVSKVKASEEKKVGKAVDKVRDEDVNVALSYVFDIHVEDSDGKEIQPADGKEVKVSFETSEVSDGNLNTDIYHVEKKGLTLRADALDVKTDGDVASAETDGFSYYTVEFTYNTLEYSITGGSELELSTVLENVGLTGTVTNAVSSNPDLFTVDNSSGVWMLKSLKAFDTHETLKVTIDGIEYVIEVTDSQHSHPNGSHGESGTWSAWSDSSNLPTESGNYYLNTDVTRSRPQIPKSGTANIKLCLNGRKITLSGGNNGLYDTDSSRNVNLTIYDSDDNSGIITNTSTYGTVIRVKAGSTYTLAGGKITNCNCSAYNAPVYLEAGTFTMKGGMICNNTLTDFAPVYVTSGIFNMSGGTITGNTNKKASGVVASGVHVTSGTFNMSGGSITNNNSPDANSAAGVYFQNSGLFNVKGKVTITGNTSKRKDLNVLVARNKTIGINGNLDSDSRIGVTTATAPSGSTTVQFTTGLSGKGSAANFISDNPDYTVMIKNGEAHLNEHKHEFEYSAEGDTITATCVNMATECSLEDRTATLKIIAPALKVYGGSESENATLEGEIPGVTPPAIVYLDGPESSTTAPKNAGQYSATITLGESPFAATASVDYEIDKATITPVVTISDWNYGEDPNEPSVTAASNPGSGAVTYKYYTDEACTKETSAEEGAKESGGVPSHGGHYWVKATVDETANYKSGTGKTGFNINAAAVKVTGLSFTSKIYDGTTAAILDTTNARLVGVPESEDVSIASATGSFSDKNVGTGKTISNITIVLSGSKAGGYAATADPETMTGNITVRDIKVNGITSPGKVYDGTTVAPLYYDDEHLVGKAEGDDLELEATGTFEDKSVGSNKKITISNLTLKGDDKDNYVLAATGQQTETKGNITEMAVNVTAKDTTKVYGDPDPTPFEYDYEPALIEGDSFEGALSRNEGEDVGDHKITLGNLHDAEGNYAINYTPGKLTITKAQTNSVTASIEGWTYGETPKTPSAAANFGANTATFTYSKTADGDYSETVPAQAGQWFVKATVPETNNYVGAVSEPVAFTIAKKTVGLEWGNTQFTYNGKEQKPAATATGLVGGDKCTVTVDGGQKDSNVKAGTASYTATAAGLSNDNYELPDNKTTTFTIAQREIKVSGIKSDGKKYDTTTDATTTLDYEEAILAGKVDGEGEYCDNKLGVTATGTFESPGVGPDKTIVLTNLTLTGSEMANYKLAETGQQETTTGTIGHHAVNVYATPMTKVYGSADPELEYTHGEIPGDYLEGKLSRHEGEDVGQYMITVGTLHDHNKDYAITYHHEFLTITQAKTNNVTASLEGWTYGDEPNEPTADADFGEDTVTFKYCASSDGVYTADVPTEAGTWYVKATVPGTKNYVAGESKPVEFSIEQKEVGLEWGDTEFTYNGNEQKPTATATGLEEGDECEVIVGDGQIDANARTGTEKYTATATGLSNPNYRLPEDRTKDFTIAPKKLTQSMISLDKDSIKYDGTKKGPKVTMTDTIEGAPAQMTEDEDYVLSGDVKSSEIGTHVITAEGKGNYTGSVMTSWVLYGKKTSGDKEEGTGGKGDLEIFVDVENTSTDVTVSNFTIDLVKGFLTKEDLARYEDGEDVLVYMILKEQTRDDTGAADRYVLGNLFREAGATDIAWYDITIWKKIGNRPAIRVNNTESEIRMTFEVPNLHRTAPTGYNREFYVGSVHDGSAKLLTSSHAFKLNVNVYRFSTFAMAYKDTEIPKNTPDNNGGGKKGNGSGKKGSGSGSSKGGANTGDENSLVLWLAVLLASAGAFGGAAYTRRRSGKSK